MWYECTFPDALEPYLPVLTHHWKLAGELDKAIAYLERSSETALRTGAYQETVDLLTEALALSSEKAAGGPRWQARHGSWNRGLGEALYGLGRFESSRAALEQALQRLDQPRAASRSRLVIQVLADGGRQLYFTARMKRGASESLRFEDRSSRPGLLTARAGVTPGFFATVRTPIIAGREFTEHDLATTPRVAILNQTLARFYFGDENPVGKRMGGPGDTAYPVEIVGVVKDQKAGTPRDQRGIWYVPYAQNQNQLRAPWCLMVRTTGDPQAAVNAVRARLRAIDASLPIFTVAGIAEQLDDVLSQERLLTILAVSFASVATLLAWIGLFGVMAYTTARRTREFGIRLALGATPSGVRGIVFQESFILVLLGVAAGFPVALAAARGARALPVWRGFGAGRGDDRNRGDPGSGGTHCGAGAGTPGIANPAL
jgi:hypothetical protein